MTGLGLGRLPALDGFTPLVLRAKLTGRSFWVVKYVGGRIINETQCDWLDLPYRGRQAMRLVCPSGQVAEIGMSGNNEGCFFQAKGAMASIGIGHSQGQRRTLRYHLIGMIDDVSGDAQCARWDYRTRTLETWRDCPYQMQFDQIGPLCPAHLGLAA